MWHVKMKTMEEVMFSNRKVLNSESRTQVTMKEWAERWGSSKDLWRDTGNCGMHGNPVLLKHKYLKFVKSMLPQQKLLLFIMQKLLKLF